MAVAEAGVEMLTGLLRCKSSGLGSNLPYDGNMTVCQGRACGMGSCP